MSELCQEEFYRPSDTSITRLGDPKVPCPLKHGKYVDEDDAVLVNLSRETLFPKKGRKKHAPAFFEHAGPRANLYFDPSKAKCAIVTCGGLCPGLNDVIRAIVMTAHHEYHVPSVLGIRYGLAGFMPGHGYDVVDLTTENVGQIHEFGGTMLGSSRGPQPVDQIVDALERMNVSILFMIGGDGTLKAAEKVQAEISKRKLSIALVGLPKTIDNDIQFASPSFGFDTAVEKATDAIRCAHVEATGAPWGIGLVKVMGRESGYIAAQSAMALQDVDFVLVPENDFDLYGENGFLAHLEKRMQHHGHAVVVVAEGAGQNLLSSNKETDKSGNPVLGDIAGLLKKEIKTYFKKKDIETTLKLIDPSYIIRSVPANANDRIYCSFLGIHAVHAGMTGRTGLVISRWNGRYVHIPMKLMTAKRKLINTGSSYWRAVLESTGQPADMKNG